jgi:beta-galactosidase
LLLSHDQFYKGQTAATRKEYGRGSVTFLGVVTNDYQLERDVVRDVFKRAHITMENYPEGVTVDWHNGLWIGVNYSDKTYIINKGNENFLIGGNELKPAGVAVWKE